MTRIQKFHEELDDLIMGSWAEQYIGEPVRLFITAYSGYDTYTEIGVLKRGPRGGYSGTAHWNGGLTPGSGSVVWANVGDIVFIVRRGPGVWGNCTEHFIVGPWDNTTVYEQPPQQRFPDVDYETMLEASEYASWYYEQHQGW